MYASLVDKWTTPGLWEPAEAEPSWQEEVRSRLRSLDGHPKQREFVVSPVKRKVVRGGRRGGKTLGVARLALDAFLAGKRVLYAVPTQDQLERFWFEVKRATETLTDRQILYKNETMHVLEVPRTENRIRAKTAWNADTLRGDYTDVLILDEYQLMNEDAWGIVGAPMLIDNDGDAVFVYTPPSWRTAGMTKAHDPRHAAKLYAMAAADTSGRWGTFHFTSHDNPYSSAEALATISADMSAQAYRQEIMAEDVEDVPGALWTTALLDRTRVRPDAVPDLVRIGIALDPAASSGPTSAEMGIIAGGVGVDGHGYVLADVSLRGGPEVSARVAVLLYDQLGADILVGEVNNGGEWIGSVLAMVAEQLWREGLRPSKVIEYKAVHASRGKAPRAHPVATQYAQGRIHHVGEFPELETQLTGWVPGMTSPDRLDADVWLWIELLLDGEQQIPTISFDAVTNALVQPSHWRAR